MFTPPPSRSRTSTLKASACGKKDPLPCARTLSRVLDTLSYTAVAVKRVGLLRAVCSIRTGSTVLSVLKLPTWHPPFWVTYCYLCLCIYLSSALAYSADLWVNVVCLNVCLCYNYHFNIWYQSPKLIFICMCFISPTPPRVEPELLN